MSERRRILALAIPPAYENVWICTTASGHLQATGLDIKGRMQYIYHPAWHEMAETRKFEGLLDFAAALPRIRARVRTALADKRLTFERVIAGVVALLDQTGYRIGSPRYVRENHSFGLTTLLSKHLTEENGVFHLNFRGKSGRKHQADIATPKLVHLISELHELPGQRLFRYEDGDGKWHGIGTKDVNQWLKKHGGGPFTAKQFRTWKATVMCARELALIPPPTTKTERDRILRQAITATAKQLNHTPATCRTYYLHPALFPSFRNGFLFSIMNGPPPRLSKINGTAGLTASERRVYKIISDTKHPLPKRHCLKSEPGQRK